MLKYRHMLPSTLRVFTLSMIPVQEKEALSVVLEEFGYSPKKLQCNATWQRINQ